MFFASSSVPISVQTLVRTLLHPTGRSASTSTTHHPPPTATAPQNQCAPTLLLLPLRSPMLHKTHTHLLLLLPQLESAYGSGYLIRIRCGAGGPIGRLQGTVSKPICYLGATSLSQGFRNPLSPILSLPLVGRWLAISYLVFILKMTHT